MADSPDKFGTPSLLDKKDIADFLGIKLSTLNQWVSQKKIPFIKLGTRVKFRMSDILAWLETKTVRPN